MKIGLYLQDLNKNMKKTEIFNRVMNNVKRADIDLLVFPECCYTPFVNDLYSIDISSEDGYLQVESFCKELSKSIGCAVIFNSEDKDGTIYSTYVNFFAKNEETFSKLYIKHTATSCSAFDFIDYKEIIRTMFEPIIYNNLKIGMTICYDCNHSLFSRAYGKNGIDILINSTGGNVVHNKWHKFNKVRAIENHCFNFCTMGYSGDYKRINSYVYGYTPTGKSMEYKILPSKKAEQNNIGKVFVYDTSIPCDGTDIDTSINQKETVNRYQHFYFPYVGAKKLISESKMITDNLFIYKYNNYNLVFCLLNNKEILAPEKVLNLMYNSKLKAINNKRYIIINKWRHLDDTIYKTQLSDVLKVRSMENYCAVILESDKFYKCYQCGNNRTAQVVKMIDGKYGLDLDRTSGPETIWKNKNGMKADWRNGFEKLLHFLESR